MTNKKTILVTGGAGFIGFHVSSALLQRGDRVLIVDNINDYYDPKIKRDRILELKKKFSDFDVFEIELSSYSDLEKVFKENKIDKVCNLAAQAGVRYSLSNPMTYVQSNIVGFVNLLELCRHHNVKDLVYASSSSVYGLTDKIPFLEEDRVDKPISLYAASKKANEEMAFTYHHLFGLNCTGLRFFNVYGPWMRPDNALLLFTKAITEGKPINVFHNSETARDYTYIDDIVSGVVSALDKSYPYEIFNLGRGESIKLMDFILEIERLLDKTAIKNLMPIQPGDVSITAADITKARKKLDFDPKTSLREGVGKFMDWYMEYFK